MHVVWSIIKRRFQNFWEKKKDLLFLALSVYEWRHKLFNVITNIHGETSLPLIITSNHRLFWSVTWHWIWLQSASFVCARPRFKLHLAMIASNGIGEFDSTRWNFPGGWKWPPFYYHDDWFSYFVQITGKKVVKTNVICTCFFSGTGGRSRF